MIEVVEPGPFATVQDLGRTGYAHLGVSRSGAADRAAFRLANRLVGNPDGTPAIEFSFGGLVVRADAAATVAFTGARCDGVDWSAAQSLPPGRVVRLAAPGQGLRSYLAVRGGLIVTPVLGSCSTDTLSGLGPAPLRAGDRLQVGPQPIGDVSGAFGSFGPVSSTVRVVLGPRDDWFTPAAIESLRRTTWRVRADSNRVGLRVDGPALPRRTEAETRELASEATLPGAIQVPPDGRPIVLGPDAPVTGGYPVIAVVLDADLDALGQLRPGDPVEFRPERLRN
ncbi:MAG: biotin-dependent carboxyltransferase family protein [Actinobacteria bacterium]|nr:biotin-dependent carboxyltransferase family protein [Actinomycetota bacterium]